MSRILFTETRQEGPWECGRCGAQITNRFLHQQWHDDLSEAVRKLNNHQTNQRLNG